MCERNQLSESDCCDVVRQRDEREMFFSEVNVKVTEALYLYVNVTSQFTAESPESVKE